MAVLSLAVNRIALAKQVLLAALAIGLLSFIVFIEFAATEAQLRFIGANNLDKIAHVAGGVFLGLAFEWLSPRRSLPLLVLCIGALAISWEAYEFFFRPDTAYFYHYAPDLWRLDTAGDIVAAYLGGYGYWIFLGDRK